MSNKLVLDKLDSETRDVINYLSKYLSNSLNCNHENN